MPLLDELEIKSMSHRITLSYLYHTYLQAAFRQLLGRNRPSV